MLCFVELLKLPGKYSRDLARNRTRGGTGSIKRAPLVTNMMVMVRGDYLLAATVTSVPYLPDVWY